MNYIYPSKNPFIIPRGKTLKRNANSISLKKRRDELKKCMNMEKSKNNIRVYEVEDIN